MSKQQHTNMDAVKHCPFCHTPLGIEAQFCGHCGQRFPTKADTYPTFGSIGSSTRRIIQTTNNRPLLFMISILLNIVFLAVLGLEMFGILPPFPFSRSSTGPTTSPTALIKPIASYPPSGWSLKVNTLMNVNDAGMGWSDSSTIYPNNRLCEFKNGAYIAQSDQPDWCLSSTNYTTFALEVQMVIVRGQEGGILFDLNGSDQTYYSFHITTDGHCIVARSDGLNKVTPALSIDCQSAIKAGQNQPNIIAVLASESSIDLYVNKVGVMVIPPNIMYTSSGTYYQHGAIACSVNSYTNGEQVPTEIRYSNLKIWQP